MSEIIRVHLNFKGYVQGVGFRYTAYHTATMYGLTGWVKNEWNGSVTVEAQGDPAAIGMFIQKVKDGEANPIAKTVSRRLQEMETLGNLYSSGNQSAYGEAFYRVMGDR